MEPAKPGVRPLARRLFRLHSTTNHLLQCLTNRLSLRFRIPSIVTRQTAFFDQANLGNPLEILISVGVTNHAIQFRLSAW